MNLNTLGVIGEAGSRVDDGHEKSIDARAEAARARELAVSVTRLLPCAASARQERGSAGAGVCALDRREMVATIIPDRNCMVATSLWSKACGVDERTSKTPSERRKWRKGATRIDRTPSRRQVAASTRGIRFGIVAEQNFAGANAVSRETAVGLKTHAEIGSGPASAGTANDFVPFAKGDGGSGRAREGLRFFSDDADAGFEIEFTRIRIYEHRAHSAGTVVTNTQMMAPGKILRRERRDGGFVFEFALPAEPCARESAPDDQVRRR